MDGIVFLLFTLNTSPTACFPLLNFPLYFLIPVGLIILSLGSKNWFSLAFFLIMKKNSWDKKRSGPTSTVWAETLASDWSDGSHGFQCRAHD